MFKTQILAKLVVAYPGLSKHLLGLVADKLAAKVTEESAIEGAIAGLNDLPISVPDFAAFLQREGDRRVTEAKKAFEDSKKPDGDEGEDKKPAGEAKPNEKGGNPEFAQLSQQLQALTSKLAAIETKEQQQTLTQKLHAKLNEKKIPVTLAKGRTVEKEDDLDTLVAEIETDYTDLRQSLVNEGFTQNSPPGGGGGGGTANIDADIKEWASNGQPAAQSAAK